MLSDIPRAVTEYGAAACSSPLLSPSNLVWPCSFSGALTCPRWTTWWPWPKRTVRTAEQEGGLGCFGPPPTPPSPLFHSSTAYESHGVSRRGGLAEEHWARIVLEVAQVLPTRNPLGGALAVILLDSLPLPAMVGGYAEEGGGGSADPAQPQPPHHHHHHRSPAQRLGCRAFPPLD